MQILRQGLRINYIGLPQKKPLSFPIDDINFFSTACDYLILFFLLAVINYHFKIAFDKSVRNFVHICLFGVILI